LDGRRASLEHGPDIHRRCSDHEEHHSIPTRKCAKSWKHVEECAERLRDSPHVLVSENYKTRPTQVGVEEGFECLLTRQEYVLHLRH
jgi:hypothetical protein